MGADAVPGVSAARAGRISSRSPSQSKIADFPGKKGVMRGSITSSVGSVNGSATDGIKSSSTEAGDTGGALLVHRHRWQYRHRRIPRGELLRLTGDELPEAIRAERLGFHAKG